MIEFKKCGKRFGRKPVLDGVNFKMAPGEIVFVIGKSGVGNPFF